MYMKQSACALSIVKAFYDIPQSQNKKSIFRKQVVEKVQLFEFSFEMFVANILLKHQVVQYFLNKIKTQILFKGE